MRYLDSLFFGAPITVRLLVMAAMLAAIAVFAWRKNQLTPGGIASAVVIGALIIYIGGISGILMMLFFFLSSAVIGKLFRHPGIMKIQKKGGRRDCVQVFANSIPAVIGLLIFRFSPYKDAGMCVFAAGLAEAVADTWSGELGMLSKSEPVSIITFTNVPKGLSGGVSLAGTLSGLAASFLMACLFVGFYETAPAFLGIVTVSGILGALFDSVLGATVQVHYRRKDGALTEHRMDGDEENERARGIPFITNDMVNFLSGLFACTIAFCLSFAL